MASSERSGKGLFGLGARPAGTGVVAQNLPAAASTLEQRTISSNLRALAGALARGGVPAPQASQLEVVGLGSRPVRFADVHSAWFAYWVGQLRCAQRPHRKLWEYVVVLQALYEAGALAADAKALGFGVGAEPLPSYLAALGLHVVATDLPEAAERDYVLNPAFVAAEAFDARVEVSNLDMRKVDDNTLRGFDACWSCSVLNEMASLEEAADTAIGVMDVLKPGGVAVHTLDFAFADDTVFPPPGELAFARRFFEDLARGLNGRGHTVSPLDFGLGDHPLDGYVDMEPFVADGAEAWTTLWREALAAPHLKLLQGGVQRTSFALIVRARP